MKDLPLELIATFVSVAERASITLAARDLAASKATVSKHVAELESRLGIVLFARTTRSLSLTEGGQVALVRAQRIISDAKGMLEDARDAKNIASGALKIAAPATFSQLWLADAIPDFMRLYPDISLELAVDDRQVDLVEEGFDAALRINIMPDSSLIARRLAPIKRYIVASPDYWAKHGKPSQPSDLGHHACIRYTNAADQGVWKFWCKDGTETRVKVEGSLTVNGGNTELPALCAGFGVGLLPDFAIYSAVRNQQLEIARLDWFAPDLTLHLLTPHGRGKPRRLEVFTEFLVSRFGARPPPWDLTASSI
jgi:DNA-binding transcriptional LysR family regulator